jgi:hypothetical protein
MEKCQCNVIARIVRRICDFSLYIVNICIKNSFLNFFMKIKIFEGLSHKMCSCNEHRVCMYNIFLHKMMLKWLRSTLTSAREIRFEFFTLFLLSNRPYVMAETVRKSCCQHRILTVCTRTYLKNVHLPTAEFEFVLPIWFVVTIGEFICVFAFFLHFQFFIHSNCPWIYPRIKPCNENFWRGIV